MPSAARSARSFDERALRSRRHANDHEIRKHVGPPLEETLARLIDDRSKIPAAVALYRERYGTQGYLENAVYPGIEAALDTLHSAGAALFVATSKPTVFATRILEHFGLSRYFRRVYGSELDGARSNKIDLLRHVCAAENISGGMMVGDRAQDIVAALAVGLTPVGALWGYGSREELEEAGARLLCLRPAALTSVPGLTGA